MALPDRLLNDTKNYLDMTWDLTEHEASKLMGIISRGMDYINRVAGVKQDYTQEGQAKALLMDYVRYVRSNALDEFAANYLPELLSLQIHQEVNGYDKKPPKSTDL